MSERRCSRESVLNPCGFYAALYQVAAVRQELENVVADLRKKFDVHPFNGGLTPDQRPGPSIGSAAGASSDAYTFTVSVRSCSSIRSENTSHSTSLIVPEHCQYA